MFKTISPCYYQIVLVPLYHYRSPNKDVIDEALSQQLPAVASYLESELIKKIFLVNDQFFIADVSFVSMFINMYVCGYSIDATIWSNLSRYLMHYFKRESFSVSIIKVEALLKRINVAI